MSRWKVSCNLSPAAMIACAFSLIFFGSSVFGAPKPSPVPVADTAKQPGPVQSRVLPRVTEAVDDSRTLKLTGNVSRLAAASYDRGEASPSTQLTHIRVLLARSAAQQAALDSYLAELQSKSSPNYHNWLTPEQFGKFYGPADSDINAVVAWAESHGLKLEEVSTGRTNIAFSGTVSQVEEAFHTQIHSFYSHGQSYFANITDPSIPSALAPVVKGVAHLNTFLPIPQNRRAMPGKMDPESKRLVPAPEVNIGGIRPDLTLGNSASTYFLYIVAGDAATIYDTPNSFNANYDAALGASYTGTGVNIGIGGAALIQAATVADYRTVFVGDTKQPTIINVDNVGANGATDEAYIDTELSGGIAPGANIYFYTSSDLVSGIERMLDDNKVAIFSLSFGECELDLSTADNAQYNGYWEEAAGLGITVTVATGDSGSAGCDANQDSSGNNVPDASAGLQVSGFASTPYNVAVGGTDLVGLDTNFTKYVGTGTSAGTSADFFRSALSFIPESTWNDSTNSNTTISANTPLTGTNSNGGPNGNIVGGGGGVSSCSTNTTVDTIEGSNPGTCTSGYARPFWQRGAGVPSGTTRTLPDVSLMAGNGNTPATWLICTDDTGTVSGVSVTANCTTQTNGNFYFLGYGGTSTSAPAFAGILALVEQKTGGRLGQAAKELYDLYNGSHAGSVFHDTTVGNNSVPCTSGTPNCTENSAGYYYESGYNTTTGYDLATGLGSVDATQLVTYWGTGVGPETATLTVTPSLTTISPAQSFTVAAAVSGNATQGVPTGTVTLSGGGYTSSAEALSGGDYTFTIPAGALSSGSDTLTVNYSGDSNYASTSKTTTVSVDAASVSLSATSLTFSSTSIGTSAAVQSVTLTNTGTIALTVSGITLTGTSTSSYSETNTCGSSLAAAATCTIAVTFTPTAVGTLTATVNIADNAANSPQTVSLTGVGAELGTYTLAAAAVTISAPGASGTSAVTGTGAMGYVGPNTVTLNSCALATSPAGASDSPTCTITGASVTFAAGSASGTGGSVSIATTAASTSAVKQKLAQAHGASRLWAGAGGLAIAGLLLFAIPARNRKWRALLGVFLFAALFGVLSGCGGGGSGGGGGGNSNPGTTTGAYTFTISGTDSNGVKQTATLNVTVN